jgi:hypothetical protein
MPKKGISLSEYDRAFTIFVGERKVKKEAILKT